MKVIFLDIDGVLNTKETYASIYKTQGSVGLYDIAIDLFRLGHLKEIIDQTDAKIVLSSSCRKLFIKENGKIVPATLKSRNLYNLFYNNGIEIFDITPENLRSREEEIKLWLSNNPDVEEFVIIDDDPTIFDELSSKLIQTSKVKQDYALLSFLKESFGLCERHIPEIVDRLGGKKKTR